MGQVPHGSARTTSAVRRAIQHSQASLIELVDRYGINASRGRCSETLFASPKVERFRGTRFQTFRQPKDETLDWLLWFNPTRLHLTLKYVGPLQFEQNGETEPTPSQADQTWPAKAGYAKAGKQNRLPKVPTASTNTNYKYL